MSTPFIFAGVLGVMLLGWGMLSMHASAEWGGVLRDDLRREGLTSAILGLGILGAAILAGSW